MTSKLPVSHLWICFCFYNGTSWIQLTVMKHIIRVRNEWKALSCLLPPAGLLLTSAMVRVECWNEEGPASEEAETSVREMGRWQCVVISHGQCSLALASQSREGWVRSGSLFIPGLGQSGWSWKCSHSDTLLCSFSSSTVVQCFQARVLFYETCPLTCHCGWGGALDRTFSTWAGKLHFPGFPFLYVSC